MCVCFVCVQYLMGSCQRVPKQKHRKGQAGVGTQFSLGHRWRGGLNVRLRLWGGGGYEEEEGS